ncbi:MAG: peptidylprolyl isomerase [Phycisphaeraceae bacterium]|nr:peptidylprolyl isomerase [Phycisphaeraceae bacterium]
MKKVCLALVMFFGACLVASPARAQLTPNREYYGINRSIPMTVSTPPGAGGAIEIALINPGSGEEVSTAAAARGGVDLASLFPVLWTSANPETLLAQLVVGGKQIGPPVVLVPMLTPRTAIPGKGGVTFSPDKNRAYSGVRAYTDKHIVFETTEGEIEIALRPDKAPNTCRHILDLVEGGFYTDIQVHRIVAMTSNGHPFVVQFGDPTGMGNGGPGRMIDLEPSDLPHDFGVISMARTPDPNTNGSQVFLCLSRPGTQFLDGQYTSFGCAVRGADTLIRMEQTPTDESGRAASPPVVTRAYTVPAPPYDDRPACVERPEPIPEER